MNNQHLSVSAANALIRRGATAVFAGAEDALARLERGCWIGGTTPYFMTERGGVIDGDNLFCTHITGAVETRIVTHSAATIHDMTATRFDDGFSYVLMPAFCDVHHTYAMDGPAFPGLCDQPVMGWVTGVLLSELGARTPKVFDGLTGHVHDNAALVMHVRLPVGDRADLDIVNLFVQGDGPEIIFPQDGFDARDCTVDGIPINFAHYVVETAIDTRLPLVADYAGAPVNVAIQARDANATGALPGKVSFYAPVLAGERYRFAKPVADYGAAYAAGIGAHSHAASMLACNCILNFLYASLEGKTTAGFVGPVTFGEIAYVLLNQTLVRLKIVQASQAAARANVPASA